MRLLEFTTKVTNTRSYIHKSDDVVVSYMNVWSCD